MEAEPAAAALGMQAGEDWLPPYATPESLCKDAKTLALMVAQGKLKQLDAGWVAYNIQEEITGARLEGGEAAVHFVRWKRPPDGYGEDEHGAERACPIAEEALVAIKVYHIYDPRIGGFKPMKSTYDAEMEALFGLQRLRKEVNMMALLKPLCADSMPEVLGYFQHSGGEHCAPHLQELKYKPLHGYVMKVYKEGSLHRMLTQACHRLLKPANKFSDWFAPDKLLGQYAALHTILQNLGGKLIYQDLTSNNLLVQNVDGARCQLVLADPSMAQLAAHLKDAKWRHHISATWIWGSMEARAAIFDPLADIYSLGVCFLEVWAVMEGSASPLQEIVKTVAADNDSYQSRAFIRALCVGMLKRQASWKGGLFEPRVQRELPLSWLFLWALLLSTEDHGSAEQARGMKSRATKRHRRPSHAAMADVAARLASVAAQIKAFGGGKLSANALAGPAGAALVGDCVALHARLAELSQLEGGADLQPLDASLGWVATRFLSLEHPLVEAMKRQGAVPAGGKALPIEPDAPGGRYFVAVVDEAKAACGWIGDMCLIKAMNARTGDAVKLRKLCLEYRKLREMAQSLLPPGDPRHAQLGVLPPDLASTVVEAQYTPEEELEAVLEAQLAANEGTERWQALHEAAGGAVPAAAAAAAAAAGFAAHGGAPWATISLLPTSSNLPTPSTTLTLSPLPQQAQQQAQQHSASPLGAAGQLPGSAAAAALPQPQGRASRESPRKRARVDADGGQAANQTTPKGARSQPAKPSTAPGHPPPEKAPEASKDPQGAQGADAPPAPLLHLGPHVYRFGPSKWRIKDGMAVLRSSGTLKSHWCRFLGCMMAMAAQRFQADLHSLLAERQAPYEAVLSAYGWQRSQLDSLVQRHASGRHYIEVSASFATPGVAAGAAPILFDASARESSSTDGLCLDFSPLMASNEANASFIAALERERLSSKGMLPALGTAAALVYFRLAGAPAAGGSNGGSGTAVDNTGAPWVPHQWVVSADDRQKLVDSATKAASSNR